MDDNQLKEIAAQLSCPSGGQGDKVAESMDKGNAFICARSIEMLDPKPREWIAEVGPGSGLLSIPIVESIGSGGCYIGMERSSDMASQAELRLDQINSSKVSFHIGDCMDAPIESNTVDGFIAVNVLYFIEDIQAFFMNISSWLKPGGRTVFGVRSEKSLRDIPFTRFGFNIRSLDEIVDALQASGFEDVKTAYYDEGIETIGGLEIAVDSQIIKATAL